MLLETMRLYPPVGGFNRVSSKDQVLSNYKIPKGTCVMSTTFVTCRLSENFEDPLTFNPNNFDPDRKYIIMLSYYVIYRSFFRVFFSYIANKNNTFICLDHHKFVYCLTGIYPINSCFSHPHTQARSLCLLSIQFGTPFLSGENICNGEQSV